MKPKGVINGKPGFIAECKWEKRVWNKFTRKQGKDIIKKQLKEAAEQGIYND